MRTRPRLRTIPILVLLALTGLAHEDDPKVLDRRPPYVGPGYSAAQRASGGGGGFQAGSGTEFPASNVTLLAWMPLSDFGTPTSGADCWGYVAPSGREYAIFGHSEGTSFVEVTDADAPRLVGTIAGPVSLWRDIKVHGSHAYVVSEGGNGIQVVSMAQIDAGVVTLVNTVTAGGTAATHNVVIDTTSGFLYRCGGADNGLRIYDLSNPASPSFVTSWSSRYVHDAQVFTYTSGPHAGRQIAFCCTGFNGGFTDPRLSILDVTNKSNIVELAHLSYPGRQYSHQGWLSEDGTRIYLNDELDEDGILPTTTFVFDVTSLTSPFLAGSFANGSTAVGHNVYTDDGLLYEANYRSGLRIFDVGANPIDPPEIAFFDTYPPDDAANFNGLWSNYPFLPSGIVLGSDMEKGLFVWWIGEPLIAFSFPAGVPSTFDPTGDGILAHLTEKTPGVLAPGSAKLHFDVGQGEVVVPLVDLGGGDFRGDLPATPCGTPVSFFFSAESTNGISWVDPPNGLPAYEATFTPAQGSVLADDMEVDLGWVSGAPGDDATTGLWVRADPRGTAAQPEDDHSDPGLRCWFTGQGSAGGSLGENDVDGGRTTLLSPLLDLSGLIEPNVGYWRWYSNSAGSSPGEDVLVVDVSGDGGSTWTNVEIVGPTGVETAGGWFHHGFRVADLVTPTATVRLRFVASDLGSGSIVEAAVDDLEVIENICPDCNGNGVSDDLDLAGGGSLDLDGDGVPDECQPLSADTDTIVLAAGGAQSFVLDAGASFAAQFHLLLGTISGTTPGTDLGGGIVLPLNMDAYLLLTLAHPNSPPLVGTFGTLDGAGRATAAFVLPAGFPSLAGTQAHHAYVVIDTVSAAAIFASNTMPLFLVP